MSFQKTLKIYSKQQALKDLPTRKTKDNKTTGGKVFVAAGSAGMWGAGQLTAQAASRCGAGYIYLLKGQKNNPDFLTLTQTQLKKTVFSAVVLGPGFRRPKTIGVLIRHWLQQKQSSVVLDAEALNWIAKNKISRLPASWVLTPHEGEMARLLQKSSAWVKENRAMAVKMAQKKYGGVVLLKGHETLVTDGQKVMQIKSGNAALAKAGSGDVLAGMLAAFLAQKKKKQSVSQMVCLAVYVHGWLADEWLRNGNDILSLRPVDLLAQLPQSLSRFRKKK